LYYNGSVADYDDKNLIVAVRKEQLHLKHSSIVVGLLSNTLQSPSIKKLTEIKYSDNINKCQYGRGLEDPRIFFNEGHFWILAAGAIPHKDKSKHKCLIGQYLIKLKKNISEGAEFIKYISKRNILAAYQKYNMAGDISSPYITQSSCDKNWNPMFNCPSTGMMLFSLEINPHVIATIDPISTEINVLYKTYNDGLHKLYGDAFAIRGGSKCIDVGDFYLAIAHIVVHGDYLHVYYLINKEAPYNIINFSAPFKILGEKQEKIQLITGIEKVSTNEMVATYGEKDSRLKIIKLDIAQCINHCMKNPQNTTYILDKGISEKLTTLGKIPHVIYQTCKDKKTLNPQLASNIKAWKQLNPTYRHELYDDNECKEFLKKHFDPKVLKAFNKLRPGAFKADLWRYAILYIHGGIYADIDMNPFKPVDSILGENYNFISVKERQNKYGIFQAFMACSPRLPFLKSTVDTICTYTETEYYPNESRGFFKRIVPDVRFVLSITGPRLLGEKYMEFIGKDLDKDETPMDVYSKNFKATLLQLGSRYVTNTNGTKVIDSKNADTNETSYGVLFENKTVYN